MSASVNVGAGCWLAGCLDARIWDTRGVESSCVGVGDRVLFGSLLSAQAACSTIPSSLISVIRLDSLHTICHVPPLVATCGSRVLSCPRRQFATQSGCKHC